MTPTPAPGPPPTLLLLHGFLGSRRDWDPVVAALGPAYRSLAVDLPGHGEAGDPGAETRWSVEGCADGLARLAAEAPGGRVLVAGYSLGGRVGLHLAARHPGVVAAAVVVSGSPGLADPDERSARRDADAALARGLEEKGIDAFLEAWYRAPLFAPLRGHPRYTEVVERRRRNDPRRLARSLRTMGLGAQASLWEELPRVTVPLLFLAGARDAKFAAIARQAAARAASAEARVVPGRGHALVEEDPAAVAVALAGFFARAT